MEFKFCTENDNIFIELRIYLTYKTKFCDSVICLIYYKTTSTLFINAITHVYYWLRSIAQKSKIILLTIFYVFFMSKNVIVTMVIRSDIRT